MSNVKTVENDLRYSASSVFYEARLIGFDDTIFPCQIDYRRERGLLL